MADTQDERADRGPTPEELLAAELAKTEQTLQLVGAMNQVSSPLPSTLPTQAAALDEQWRRSTATAPSAIQNMAPSPPPMAGAQPPIMLPPQPAPVAAPRNRIYMGPMTGAPNASPQEFFGDAPNNTNINLMPPPTPEQGAAASSHNTFESDAAALARMQAADKPGSRTIGVNSNPYSDASLANQQNVMRYNAMKAFEAGDRSPEVLAAAMGTRMVGSPLRPMTEYQRSMDSHRKFLEQQAANKVVPPPRNMAAEKAINDERAALYKARLDLAQKPASDGTDPRVGNAMQHAKKLKELQDQYMPVRPATATATTPAPVAPTPPVQPPVAAKKAARVKVIGPGGKKGTIEEGDSLPSGWKLAQ